MNRNASRLVLISFLVLNLIPVLIVYANVPTVVGVELETQGQDTFLVIQVRHSSPSQTHYVDVVDVEVAGKVEKVKLDPQSTTSFTVQRDLDSPATDIRVRAHCTNHGWSPWVSLDSEDAPGGGIPGFPYEAIVLGLTISSALLLAARRRRL